MAKYAKVRTDLMHGSENIADLVSVKFQVSNADTAIENGNVVVVGGLVSGETNVYTATTPAANSALSTLALIATPELIYTTPDKDYTKFRNEAGEIARAYRLRSGDIFSATIEAFGGRATLDAVVVGDVVECQASTKLKLVPSLTTSSTRVGEVIAVEGDYVVVRVD